MARYDIMAPTRQYTAGDGSIKTAWLKCGAMFTDDTGKPKSLVLECTPTVIVDREGQQVAWDGRLMLFEPREQAPSHLGNEARRQRAAPAAPPAGDFDDSIPF